MFRARLFFASNTEENALSACRKSSPPDARTVRPPYLGPGALLVCLLLILPVATEIAIAAEGAGRQALATNRLRVCADPANLPYSDENLGGFENRIIELLAEDLDLQVRYTWYPQSTGFVRNTLRVRECDVISGITTTSERVQNTNPYYHSIYTMVYRRDSGLEARTMTDPALKELRLGVVAGTPPADILATEGLMANVRPYQLVTDTRRARPAERALEDVSRGEIDVAFIWGPIAGYHARENPEAELVIVPLLEEDERVRLDFSVSMAVRYNETDWKRTVNRLLARRASEIESILLAYGVPLLDETGDLVMADAGEATDAGDASDANDSGAGVAEPAGFRMEDYDAPVPLGLSGATTVTGADVESLMRDHGAAVIDVIPEHRKPPELPDGELWLPPPHAGIPGAAWLPDTGYGALDPITEKYLFSHLETLSGGDTDHPLVFYCRMDCWMSWNAAKRALEAGYSNVHWYRDGIDDWQFDDRFTVALEPAEGKRQVQNDD